MPLPENTFHICVDIFVTADDADDARRMLAEALATEDLASLPVIGGRGIDIHHARECHDA